MQVTEEEYPYTSGDPWGDGDDQKCKFDARTTEVYQNFEAETENKVAGVRHNDGLPHSPT